MWALYLVDTCAWLDVFSSHHLLKDELRDLIASQSLIRVAAIRLWEVARKEADGQLHLQISLEQWFHKALAIGRCEVLPIDPQIAINSTRLPGMFHKDPADHLVVATARQHHLTLLTSDRKILNYAHVNSLASR